MRIHDDGGIPADNPFVGRKDANPQVFTFGRRNVTEPSDATSGVVFRIEPAE